MANINRHSIKAWLSANASFVGGKEEMLTLHSAAWKGDLQSLKKYVDLRLPNPVLDTQEYTALHLAVWNMHHEAVKLLLDSPIQIRASEVPAPMVDSRAPKGETPLHLAVWNHDIEMVKILLQAGAKTFVSDVEGRSVMHWAAANGWVDI